MASKRLTLRNLIPGGRYAVQVRAVTNEGASAWSQKYNFRAADDTMGGTRTPKAPVLNSFEIDGSGQFTGRWSSVTQNTDNSALVVTRYEIELFGWDGRPIIAHTPKSGTTQERSFSYAAIRSLFTGIPSSITMKVRVVNSAGTTSPWSNALTATLPVPMPPRNPVATGVVDGISVKWDAPESMANVAGYRVFASIGAPADFPMIKELNLIYEGLGLSTTMTSLSYNEIHYFKIVSFSEAEMVSTFVTANAKPLSPFGPDTNPPLKPTLGNPAIDRSAPGSPKATLSWTINETAADNQDIAGFAIRWRRAGDSHWNINYFDKTARAGSIELPYAYANYQFEISAYDWMGNYSDYAGTLKTLTAAAPPPPQVVGLNSDARFDGLKLYWTASTSPSVLDGGGYEIQVRSANSFTDTPIDYTTGNTFIDLVLPIGSTRYFRVRAYDTSGQKGPWSVVHSKALPAFPEPAKSDGVAPTAAPTNVIATGGINYINVSWTQVNNNDPVTYEVYMAEFSAGVTDVAITPANLVGKTTGSSLTVTTLQNGNPLAKSGIYMFKVRAVDYDGAGPASVIGEKSGTSLNKVIPDDLGIDLPGENLYFNSSFDEDSDGNGVADYWSIYYFPAVTGTTVTGSLVTGRTGGKAQRVSWDGPHSSYIGVRSINASVLRPHTDYILSFYGRASGGTGFGTVFSTNPATGSIAAVEKPVPSATMWQRYIFRFRTAATVDVNNVYIVIQGLTVAGWMEIDDAQIEAGNMVSAYKTGTVSIAKLTTGRLTSSDMIISTGGRIVSETYLANSNTGFLITDSGITIKEGQIDAKTLVANSTITNSLFVGSTLTVANSGTIRSQNYSTTGTGTGYSISSVGIDIRSGTVAAGALVAGIITSPDIRVGANGKITIDSTGAIQSNNYNLTSKTGWKISATGIEMWDTNSKINVNSLQTGTLESTTITLGSGGSIQSKNWAAGGAFNARWQLSELGLTMNLGTITGATIVTDQLYSAQETIIAGVSRKRFSINSGGYAEFVGANVYGNTILGNNAANTVQSGNYSAVEGWKIAGNGDAVFKTLVANSGNSANGTFIKIGNHVNPYQSNQGWAVISMHTNNTAWEPGLIWTNFTSAGSTGTGFLRISSPQANASSVAASYLSLSYNSADINKSRIDLKATDVYMSAENYWMGGGDGPVSFIINPTNSSPDRRFQFIDYGVNKRIEFRYEGLDISIVALDNTTTRSRMTLRARDFRFEVGTSSHDIELVAAPNASNRSILASPLQNVGVLWAGVTGENNGSIQIKTLNGSDFRPLYSSNLAQPSDIRFKKDVRPYRVEGTLDKINSLEIKSYKMIAEGDDRSHVGLIAQDVQKVFPDAIDTPPEEERMFLDNYYLLSMALASIQELSAKVVHLEEQVRSLSK